MSLSADQIQSLARALLEAESSLAPIAPITDQYPDISIEDAYSVQLAIIAAHVKAGRKVVGKKVGLTSRAMQEMLGVDQPDYGVLFEDMITSDGGSYPAGNLVQPRVEPEIAFMLKSELKGPGITVADVLAATDYVFPALEVVASRIKDWKIKLADTIADNASSGRFVMGDAHKPVEGLDLVGEGLIFEKNGVELGRATGEAVLDNPANAVAWCANKLCEYGESLEAGQLILPGALTGMTPVVPGDTITARFSTIGTVSVSFT